MPLRPEPVTVTLSTSEALTVEELAEKISQIVPIEEVPKFIALLEKEYESWWVSEMLIKHFKHLEIQYKKGFMPHERADLSASSLLKKTKKAAKK